MSVEETAAAREALSQAKEAQREAQRVLAEQYHELQQRKNNPQLLQHRCSVCGGIGHNSRTCSMAVTPNSQAMCPPVQWAASQPGANPNQPQIFMVQDAQGGWQPAAPGQVQMTDASSSDDAVSKAVLPPKLQTEFNGVQLHHFNGNYTGVKKVGFGKYCVRFNGKQLPDRFDTPEDAAFKFAQLAGDPTRGEKRAAAAMQEIAAAVAAGDGAKAEKKMKTALINAVSKANGDLEKGNAKRAKKNVDDAKAAAEAYPHMWDNGTFVWSKAVALDDADTEISAEEKAWATGKTAIEIFRKLWVDGTGQRTPKHLYNDLALLRKVRTPDPLMPRSAHPTHTPARALLADRAHRTRDWKEEGTRPVVQEGRRRAECRMDHPPAPHG